MIKENYSNDLLCSLFMNKENCMSEQMGPPVYHTPKHFLAKKTEQRIKLAISKAYNFPKSKDPEVLQRRLQGNYRRKRRPEQCGFLGVHLNKENKYSAYIIINSEHIYLGVYPNPEVAFLVRQAVLIDIYGQAAYSFKYTVD